ncbi:pentapeptide repeat-containing protein [Mucilaginibacter myungsuensis]|uniref:Pentapeptide repeat-containing protein n=1 Tax=Mucilaginibacter myungsuensis TaxID=649104 RepID=A0A929KVY9_9SPHI|nr:pentapeptide repeat-containing protein [Mucilaginibacter myungsuensis]MBE9662157.1 pentapeptide repeat-containing protein [Mucilaginibacter myungsuensis]MDN3599409.1 pentapeptide repeat-containing protein [Mucilaginibacter myungsuensis]
MQQPHYEDKTFEGFDYSGQVTKGGEFQSCTFKKCNFSEADMGNNKFLDCVFESCNLSMVKLGGTTLSDVRFKDCKILGVHFFDCQDFLFSVAFDNCILDYSSFMRKKMVKTKFANSSLMEVNFTQTILTNSVFDKTELSGAVFNGTDLSSANFTLAYNYSIDPELNNVKKASFSLDGVPGLLEKYGLKIV